MSPEREKIINGVRYAEFYWGGEYPCYVDHRLSSLSFDRAVALAEQGEDAPLVPWKAESK